MRHLPLRATRSLCHALHIISILDEDNDDDEDEDDDDEALLMASVSSGIRENMFTNASSSVFITSLMPNDIMRCDISE